MQRNALHNDPLPLRPPLAINTHSLNSIQRLETVNDLAENGILPIQRGLRAECYEELGAICVWTFVCHADDPAGVVAEGGAQFVFERLAVYAWGCLWLWLLVLRFL